MAAQAEQAELVCRALLERTVQALVPAELLAGQAVPVALAVPGVLVERFRVTAAPVVRVVRVGPVVEAATELTGPLGSWEVDPAAQAGLEAPAARALPAGPAARAVQYAVADQPAPTATAVPVVRADVRAMPATAAPVAPAMSMFVTVAMAATAGTAAPPETALQAVQPAAHAVQPAHQVPTV
jgi:hypothetical protein